VSIRKVSLSDDILGILAKLRRKKLPVETGGMLFAVVDMEQRLIQISSPSVLRPIGGLAGSERGAAGRRGRIVRRRTQAVSVGYIGKWHSHPKARAATPSPKDILPPAGLANFLDRNGVPCVGGQGRRQRNEEFPGG
jgi:hypothetical protein